MRVCQAKRGFLFISMQLQNKVEHLSRAHATISARVSSELTRVHDEMAADIARVVQSFAAAQCEAAKRTGKVWEDLAPKLKSAAAAAAVSAAATLTTTSAAAPSTNDE